MSSNCQEEPEYEAQGLDGTLLRTFPVAPHF